MKRITLSAHCDAVLAKSEGGPSASGESGSLSRDDVNGWGNEIFSDHG